MPAKLIVNADDFGWDPDATQAILRLAAQYRISSTTVMANLVQPQDLYRLSANTHISVGVHINLISGKPLSAMAKVPTLIDPETGLFYNSSALWLRYLKGKVNASEIKEEVKTQIAVLADHGISVSHADSHQHIHVFPGLSKIIIRALKEAGIARLRNCSIPEFFDKRRLLIRIFNEWSKRGSKDFSSPELLISAFSIYKNKDRRMFTDHILPHLKNRNVVEMMVHPGLSDRQGSYLDRKAEYDFLMNGSWLEWLKEFHVELVNYNQL